GVRASHTAQVILEDCFVAEDARLGYDKEGNATGPGAIGAMLMLEATRPLIAAGAVGIARAAFEVARDYSLERVAFGKPIAKHEAIAFKLADMATEIDAARLLTWRAGWMAQNGVPFARGEGSMAKLFSGDMAMVVTGGARGLGRADCLALARAGADVVVTDILIESDPQLEKAAEGAQSALAQLFTSQHVVYAEKTSDEIRQMGRRSAAMKMDVTDRDQVREVFGQIRQEFGSLDILINNAATLDHVAQIEHQN